MHSRFPIDQSSLFQFTNPVRRFVRLMQIEVLGAGQHFRQQARQGTGSSVCYRNNTYKNPLMDILLAGTNKQYPSINAYGVSSTISICSSEDLPTGTIIWQLAVVRVDSKRISALETEVNGHRVRQLVFRTDDASVDVYNIKNGFQANGHVRKSSVSQSQTIRAKTRNGFRF